jgi:hypothetical protein
MTEPRIKVEITKEYYEDFTGSLESIIASLQAELDAGWEGIKKEWESYCDSPSFYLYKFREETDKEYDRRMKQLEKEKAEKSKAKERKLQQLKKELASLSDKEIETHKSQPKMKFLFDGKCEVVSYNKKSYYRFEFPDEVYWYRRTSYETYLDLKLQRITDSETHRLLEGLWFNDARHGKDLDTL